MNKTETITIRITEQEKNELKAIAARHSTTLSNILRELVKDYLKTRTQAE